MKNLTIEAINGLLKAEHLMNQMANLIMQLGGDLWESKYGKINQYHIDTVFNLCVKDAKYLNDKESLDNAKDCFFECVFQIARGYSVDIEIINDNNTIHIATAEDIYNYFTQL